ncbi:dTDP-glucose 4,6-dehydratase [Synechococcus sp. AH-601-J22]|nr:dTDP-glucose 4,6-dehydratase [Synechococcus sp. AH-601-J22]
MTFSMPSAAELVGSRQRVLVTGGGGFIGGAVVRRLLRESTATVFNLDKMGYASDLTSIEEVLAELGDGAEQRHVLQKIDLTNAAAVQQAVEQADPDLVMHLAAESHVDRSISGPGVFIQSNVTGTFNLLQAVRSHYEQLNEKRKEQFRLHHISTDEVFGSLGPEGRFSETTPYDPRSPYSASKAASDHLVRAWHHTYELPVVLTNCSNNYGHWQFPEKLIPVVILKAAAGEAIPLYGDGLNVRDWLYVEDHVDALLLAACRGQEGLSYCIGGHGERTNLEVVEAICKQLDQEQPKTTSHINLITPVTDRLGHDKRYAIDPTKITEGLGWKPRHSFDEGLTKTVRWYLNHTRY